MAAYAPIPDCALLRYDYDGPATGPNALADPAERARIMMALAAFGGISPEVMRRPGDLFHDIGRIYWRFFSQARRPPDWFTAKYRCPPLVQAYRDSKRPAENAGGAGPGTEPGGEEPERGAADA